MSNVADNLPFRATGFASTVTVVLVFAIRAIALLLFLVMSLVEPFLAVVLSALSVGCFLVAVLFGFLFHAPFVHRWFVLGASVGFLLAYVLYRFVMQGVQSLLR